MVSKVILICSPNNRAHNYSGMSSIQATVNVSSEYEVRIPRWPSLFLKDATADKRELPHFIRADFRDVQCCTIGADRDSMWVSESLEEK
jgi:hypothetical protein